MHLQVTNAECIDWPRCLCLGFAAKNWILQQLILSEKSEIVSQESSQPSGQTRRCPCGQMN